MDFLDPLGKTMMSAAPVQRRHVCKQRLKSKIDGPPLMSTVLINNGKIMLRHVLLIN
jgi:hypothetical protein